MIDPDLLAISRGDAPADVVFTNARVVDVFLRRIEHANVAVHGRTGLIAGVGDYTRAVRTIDLKGAFIAPGFLDAHMHVESTMLPPREFVRLAVPHGTTGAVFDPHEIANVLGVDGIRAVMADAEGLPFRAMFALSSCVPASHLETSGARLEAADLEPLFNDARVVALAEVMNFPGVVRGDCTVLAKIALGLRHHVVDGHAPGLKGRSLNAYVAAGISSDHECTTREEAEEKTARGMHVHIREGSAARNLDALLPAVTEARAHLFSFCTDDRHPADLRDEGHIDHVVRRAVRAGLNPCTAIAMASLHTAQHYRRPDLGAVAPGRRADIVIMDDLESLRVRRVYVGGRLVAEDGAYLGETPDGPDPLTAMGHSVRLRGDLSTTSLRVTARGGRQVRVIGMRSDQLVTDHLLIESRPIDGEHRADPARDVLKVAVIERHRATGNIGVGFVRGFGLKHGAIASTVGHDSHNLIVVGTNDSDMITAARALEAAGGGQCAVQDGKVLALLVLPIAGLMSDQPAERVIERQRALLHATQMLGCSMPDPFMPLSFIPLPVIPHLKLTDKGLVDADQFQIIELET